MKKLLLYISVIVFAICSRSWAEEVEVRGGSFLLQIAPFVLIFIVFYFLLKSMNKKKIIIRKTSDEETKVRKEQEEERKVLKSKIVKEKKRIEEEGLEKQNRIRDNELRELFQTAQEGIDHNAMYKLAELYFIGNGLEKNYVEAMYWIYKAEVLGNSNAPTLRKNIEMVASEIQISVAHNKLAGEGK